MVQEMLKFSIEQQTVSFALFWFVSALIINLAQVVQSPIKLILG